MILKTSKGHIKRELKNVTRKKTQKKILSKVNGAAITSISISPYFFYYSCTSGQSNDSIKDADGETQDGKKTSVEETILSVKSFTRMPLSFLI